MTFLQLVVIAVVQGITEFLPISSSGHLVLIPWVFTWPDQGQAIDVAVHVGTLGAVVVYVWRDLWSMCVGVVRRFSGRDHPGAKLFLYFMVASLPVGLAGLAYSLWGGVDVRTPLIVGWSTLIFGLVLYGADKFGLTVRRLDHMTMGSALGIGVAQTLALIPGASRAGITITAARMMGFERRDAARFSMMLSIPTIAGAGLITWLELLESGDTALRSDALLAGGLAFLTALVAIILMMSWLRRASYGPFVIYRVILGVAILGYFYIG